MRWVCGGVCKENLAHVVTGKVDDEAAGSRHVAATLSLNWD